MLKWIRNLITPVTYDELIIPLTTLNFNLEYIGWLHSRQMRGITLSKAYDLACNTGLAELYMLLGDNELRDALLEGNRRYDLWSATPTDTWSNHCDAMKRRESLDQQYNIIKYQLRPELQQRWPLRRIVNCLEEIIDANQ